MGKSARVAPLGHESDESDDEEGPDSQISAEVAAAKERETSIADMISALKIELEQARGALRRAEAVENLGTTGAVGGGVDTGGAAEMAMKAKTTVSLLESQLQELYQNARSNEEELQVIENERIEYEKKLEAAERAAEFERLEAERKKEEADTEAARQFMLARKQSEFEASEVQQELAKQKAKELKKARAREAKQREAEKSEAIAAYNNRKLTFSERKAELASRRSLMLLKPLVNPPPKKSNQSSSSSSSLPGLFGGLLSVFGDGKSKNDDIVRFTDNWSLGVKIPLRDWAGVTVGVTGVTVIGLTLTEIELGGDLGDEQWGKFMSAAVHLTSFNIARNTNLTGDISNLTTLKSLVDLCLDNCTSVSGELESLTNLINLEKLSLRCCPDIKGDVGSLCPLTNLKTLDVSQSEFITELPTSWFLRVVRPQVKSAKILAAWPPWGDPDWRSCYKRLKARPNSGNVWMAKKNPELAAEWDQEELRHAEWLNIDFSRTITELPKEPEGDLFAGNQPECWGALGAAPDQAGLGDERPSESRGGARRGGGGRRGGASRGSVNFGDLDDSDEDDEKEEVVFDDDDDHDDDADTLERARRRAKRKLLATPSNNVPSRFSGKVASLGWIVALRLPDCGFKIEVDVLYPILLNRNLRSLDLSRNKKVSGDIEIFRNAECDELREVFLHYTDVTGDYKSVSNRYLPSLKICLLQGTRVIGNLAHLPGDTSRPPTTATPGTGIRNAGPPS